MKLKQIVDVNYDNIENSDRKTQAVIVGGSVLIWVFTAIGLGTTAKHIFKKLR